MSTEICIKCGKGDNVLVCTSFECPVTIHESCLPSSLQVDDTENFCCPYCLYKQSVAELRQAKDKALLAQKNLSLFLGAKSIGGECGLVRDSGKSSDNHVSSSTPARCSNGLKPVKDENNCDGPGIPCPKLETDEGDPVSACNERTENYRNEVYTRLAKKSIQNEIEFKNCSPSEEVSDKSSGSEDYGHDPNTMIVVRDAGCIDKPSKKIVDGTSSLRRKRVRWTTEEEEMLEKGVVIFSQGVKKNLSWRKILAFGSHVFHPSRTPMDLQSKWKIFSRK